MPSPRSSSTFLRNGWGECIPTEDRGNETLALLSITSTIARTRATPGTMPALLVHS